MVVVLSPLTISMNLSKTTTSYPVKTGCQDVQELILEGISAGLDKEEMLLAIRPHNRRMVNKKHESTGKEIKLPTGKFMMIMPSVESERVFIGGRSGMGKSTVAAGYAMEYQKRNPDNMIHIFSWHEEDNVYEGLQFEQITLSLDILDAHILIAWSFLMIVTTAGLERLCIYT